MGKVEILKVRYDNWQGPKGKLSSYNKDDIYMHIFIFHGPWRGLYHMLYVTHQDAKILKTSKNEVSSHSHVFLVYVYDYSYTFTPPIFMKISTF